MQSNLSAMNRISSVQSAATLKTPKNQPILGFVLWTFMTQSKLTRKDKEITEIYHQ